MADGVFVPMFREGASRPLVVHKGVGGRDIPGKPFPCAGKMVYAVLLGGKLRPRAVFPARTAALRKAGRFGSGLGRDCFRDGAADGVRNPC